MESSEHLRDEERHEDESIKRFEEGVGRLEQAFQRLEGPEDQPEDGQAERLEEGMAERLEGPVERTDAEVAEPLEERARRPKDGLASGFTSELASELNSRLTSGKAGSQEEADDCLCETCKITLELKDAHIQGVNTANGDCGGCGEEGDARPLVLSDEKRMLGLFGMIERIELAGCSLRFDFRPDEGTTIHLEVPIESEGREPVERDTDTTGR